MATSDFNNGNSVEGRGLNLQTMRSPEWARLTTNARYLNALAMRAGLKVLFYEGEKLCWMGAPERLQNSGIFPAEKRLASKRPESLSSGGGVSARITWLKRSGEVMVWPVFSLKTSDEAQNQTLRRAATDAGYQKFRVAMLHPIDEIDAE